MEHSKKNFQDIPIKKLLFVFLRIKYSVVIYFKNCGETVMFNCHNCLKNKNGKCVLSIPLEDDCMCNKFRYYEEMLPVKRRLKQQRAMVHLDKALEICRQAGLSLVVRDNNLCGYDSQ